MVAALEGGCPHPPFFANAGGRGRPPSINCETILINALTHRNFTVASAIAASIAPISQNLTTTCDSVQPFRWKW